MEKQSILELQDQTRAGSVDGDLHAQLEEIKRKEGSNGKPFWELRLRDAGSALVLRVWSDTPNFAVCESLASGDCVGIQGEFYQNGNFGLDARRWKLRRLSDADADALFRGDEALEDARERDYAFVSAEAEALTDPRLRALAVTFLEIHGPRFRRAAAARANHHAERGGLLRHTAQMMRSAKALAGVYPELNADLLVTGVLFHDCGKLWETCPPERGFAVEPDRRGAMIGHINIGVEVVNSIWRDLPRSDWDILEPASEDVRLHLLHLILAHHGTHEFGSPVLPKTPEAAALHFIDNLDARLEMFAHGYASQPEIAPGIFERVRPLEVSPVQPLKRSPAGLQPEKSETQLPIPDRISDGSDLPK